MNDKSTNNKRETSYFLLASIGMFLLIWEIFIYRRTIIDLKVLYSIIIFVGIISTLLDFKNLVRLIDLKGWKLYLLAFIQSTVSWGVIACSVFVLSNFYLSTGDSTQQRYTILETSSMPSGDDFSRQPLFLIKYKGKIKELVFDRSFYSNRKAYKAVNIKSRKGFWGWDIIIEQNLE